MKNTTKYLLYTLNVMTIVFLILFFWPAAILVLINFIVLLLATNEKRNDPLKTKIEETANQFGIRYGTPEEKLEQLTAIAAKAQELEEKP